MTRAHPRSPDLLEPHRLDGADDDPEEAKDRGTLRKRLRAAGSEQQIANVLATLSLVLFAVGSTPWITIVAAGLAIAASTRTSLPHVLTANQRTAPVGSYTIPRVMVIIVIAGFYETRLENSAVWIAAGLLILLVAAEPTIAKIARGAIPYGANLSGLSVRNSPIFGAAIIFYANTAALLLLALFAAVLMPAWVAIVVFTVVCVPTGLFALDGVVRVRQRRKADRTLNSLLKNYAPAFAIHWDAPANTLYQLSMWLPYLERLNKNFVIILRNPRTFEAVRAITESPVLLRRQLLDLDSMLVPTLKAAFYVNNGPRNAHFVKFSKLTHIQLFHGDSDKTTSYNPVLRMYDKNFVAGQAAIDRFTANSIPVRDEFFAIVGRPQVESVVVATRHISETGAKTILYAPTWRGHSSEADYCSLPVAYGIISDLVDRGCRIVFRPHPYTDKDPELARESKRIKELLHHAAADSGRDHAWGARAESEMSTIDCFNEADAMLSDVSSVVPDFLYSEKPLALVSMMVSAAEFIASFPIAKGAYIIDRSLENSTAQLTKLIETDPVQQTRQELKKYYLGDFPADSYANGFLDEARKFI